MNHTQKSGEAGTATMFGTDYGRAAALGRLCEGKAGIKSLVIYKNRLQRN